jgi:RimJ/RimL family protein N-acetyltransferase
MKAPDIRLKSARVTIRPLVRQDLRTMAKWPTFEDPLYQLFDWPKRSGASDDLWYHQLMRDRARVYYAVEDEFNELIGRISLREIEGQASARLGIGFSPKAVGCGYGTEALQAFLEHYFVDLGFRRMVLDVAAVNRRAVRCYERCGFRREGSRYQYAGSDDDLLFLQEHEYRHLRQYFRRESYRNTVLAYDMVLDVEDWLIHNQM